MRRAGEQRGEVGAGGGDERRLPHRQPVEQGNAGEADDVADGPGQISPDVADGVAGLAPALDHPVDNRADLLAGMAAHLLDEAPSPSERTALRLAQAAWFQVRSGVRPVLLADDVLGELDPARRRRFWAAIDAESQVIATGTKPPDAELGAWQLFAVADGTFLENPPDMEAKA